MLKTEKIEYYDGDVLLEGHYAYDDNINGRRPAVLIAHDWSGKTEFTCDKANKLAELGYVGFALDMYGKGKTGETKEEKIALMNPLIQNRALLQKRILSAYEAVKKLDKVATSSIGAMGFCFGGLCVLDLARSGADVKGVVSFHGLLHAPDDVIPHPIQSKILVMHGYDDPMVTPDKINLFADEMNQARVDWQFHIFSHTMHAFTNPKANDPAFGTVYNKTADQRSWLLMKEFFRETLGK